MKPPIQIMAKLPLFAMKYPTHVAGVGPITLHVTSYALVAHADVN